MLARSKSCFRCSSSCLWSFCCREKSPETARLLYYFTGHPHHMSYDNCETFFSQQAIQKMCLRIRRNSYHGYTSSAFVASKGVFSKKEMEIIFLFVVFKRLSKRFSFVCYSSPCAHTKVSKIHKNNGLVSQST